MFPAARTDSPPAQDLQTTLHDLPRINCIPSIQKAHHFGGDEPGSHIQKHDVLPLLADSRNETRDVGLGGCVDSAVGDRLLGHS